MRFLACFRCHYWLAVDATQVPLACHLKCHCCGRHRAHCTLTSFLWTSASPRKILLNFSSVAGEYSKILVSAWPERIKEHFPLSPPQFCCAEMLRWGLRLWDWENFSMGVNSILFKNDFVFHFFVVMSNFFDCSSLCSSFVSNRSNFAWYFLYGVT